MLFLSTSVEAAAKALREGALAALPSETVYGLGADACSEAAVQQIFALKGRPANNPLIVHVTGAAMAQRYVHWNDLAQSLAAQHWPGALTLVLKRRENCAIAPSVMAGGDTLAMRAPAHPLMREVIAAHDGGIAAPSANRSGRISPTCAQHVLDEFPHADLLVLDGGDCDVGLESTVVDCTGDAPRMLRVGAVDIACHGESHDSAANHHQDNTPLRSPGMLSSHYAPNLPVRLNAHSVRSDEALLAFGEPLAGAGRVLNLSETADIEQAARQLFAMLRALDSPEFSAIAVMPVPEQPALGAAINDRLKRAAAQRE